MKLFSCSIKVWMDVSVNLFIQGFLSKKSHMASNLNVVVSHSSSPTVPNSGFGGCSLTLTTSIESVRTVKLLFAIPSIKSYH